MPPELKDAAKALTNADLYRPSRKGGPGKMDAVHTCSINETLLSLARLGLEQMFEIVQSNLEQRRKELEPYSELMAFFLADPVLEKATIANFPSGSPARYLFAENDEQREMGHPDEWTRADAALEYSLAQRVVQRLTAAKGAILKALPE
jgi:hypothetical protein